MMMTSFCWDFFSMHCKIKIVREINNRQQQQQQLVMHHSIRDLSSYRNATCPVKRPPGIFAEPKCRLQLQVYLGEVRAGLIKNRVVRVFQPLFQGQQTVHRFILVIQRKTYEEKNMATLSCWFHLLRSKTGRSLYLHSVAEY